MPSDAFIPSPLQLHEASNIQSIQRAGKYQQHHFMSSTLLMAPSISQSVTPNDTRHSPGFQKHYAPSIGRGRRMIDSIIEEEAPISPGTPSDTLSSVVDQPPSPNPTSLVIDPKPAVIPHTDSLNAAPSSSAAVLPTAGTKAVASSTATPRCSSGRLWPSGGLISTVRRNRRGILLTLVGVSSATALICAIVFAHSYILHLFLAAQQASPVLCVAVFMALYIFMSWPFTWGFSVVNAAGGYLFGVVGGVAVSSAGALLGVFLVHNAIRKAFASRFEPLVRRNAYLRNIARLLSESEEAYKFVLLSRMTPIPFGMQNVVFAVSSIDTRTYLACSTIGLIPIQSLYCYLGSTLRSMEEVFSGGGSTTARAIFFGQLAVGGVVMYLIITKARYEINKALEKHKERRDSEASSVHDSDGVHVV